MSVAKGREGERRAEAFLRDKGYEIIARNVARRGGEIDLIARDGSTLVFVEVKMRTSARFGAPGEAVHRKKQRRICKAALEYLSEVGGLDGSIRFDVVELTPSSIRHLQAAFDYIE